MTIIVGMHEMNLEMQLLRVPNDYVESRQVWGWNLMRTYGSRILQRKG